MVWSFLVRPEFLAPTFGLVGVLVGSAISAWANIRTNRERLAADQKLAERKFEFDKELAERKFDFDRSQLNHKRRFELAETLLTDAYRFRDLMRYVRNGYRFGAEGESREGDVSESESRKRLKDSYFVPIERLQKQSEFVSGFMVKRYTALSHFGSSVGEAFQLFDESIHSVEAASGELIAMANNPDYDPNRIEQLLQDVQAGRGQTNKVSKNIEEGVSFIENLCRPALKWKGE